LLLEPVERDAVFDDAFLVEAEEREVERDGETMSSSSSKSASREPARLRPVLADFEDAASGLRFVVSVREEVLLVLGDLVAMMASF
jgi:hypothetical protein